MTTKELINKVNAVELELKDVAKVLRNIRGVNWEDGLDNDQRHSVTVLRKVYYELKEEYNFLMNYDLGEAPHGFE